MKTPKRNDSTVGMPSSSVYVASSKRLENLQRWTLSIEYWVGCTIFKFMTAGSKMFWRSPQVEWGAATGNLGLLNSGVVGGWGASCIRPLVRRQRCCTLPRQLLWQFVNIQAIAWIFVLSNQTPAEKNDFKIPLCFLKTSFCNPIWSIFFVSWTMHPMNIRCCSKKRRAAVWNLWWKSIEIPCEGLTQEAARISEIVSRGGLERVG